MKTEPINFEDGLDIPGLDAILEDEFLNEANVIDENNVELQWCDGTSSTAIKIGNDWIVSDNNSSDFS